MNILDVVQDPLVLSEKHIPHELVGRRILRETLAAYIRAAASGMGASVYVYGRPGTGKTALLRHLLNDYSTGNGLYLTDPQGWDTWALPATGSPGYLKYLQSKDELGQFKLATKHDLNKIFSSIEVALNKSQTG